jgi:hypothetical protein
MEITPNYPPLSDVAVKTQNAPVEGETAAPAPTIPPEANPPQAPAPVPAEILAETLLGYGYKATAENKEMLRAMLKEGIPLTKENIGRMNQAVKLTGSAEKALFMLQNNMRMTQANATQLEGFVSGQTKISAQISNLLAAVSELNDPALAGELKKILAGKEQPQGQTEVPAETQSAAKPQVQTQTPQQAQTTMPQPQVQAQPAQPPQAVQAPPTQQQPVPQAQSQPVVQTQTAPPTQTTAQTQVPAPAPQTSTEAQPAVIREGATALPQAAATATAPSAPAANAQAAPVPAQQPSAIPQNLLFPLEGSTPQAVSEYLSNLRETLAQMQTALEGRNTPEAARVLQEVRTLESHMEFTPQIRNQSYVQLPLFHNGEQTQTALHVYKDGKKSGGGSGNSDSTSALIALETTALGHFETYVQKNSRGISCQFRLESDEIAAAVRDNIHKLSELLQNSGYSLEAFSFLPPGEPYTVLDTPKSITSQKSSPQDIPHFNECV